MSCEDPKSLFLLVYKGAQGVAQCRVSVRPSTMGELRR